MRNILPEQTLRRWSKVVGSIWTQSHARKDYVQGNYFDWHNMSKDGTIQKRKGDLLGLVAVLLWSTVATAFKLSLRHLSPAQLLLLSCIVSWLFLSAVLLYRGMFRAAFRNLKSGFGRAFLMGLLNPCLYYLILFEAYDLLPAQEAQALNYTWALTISLLAVPILGHALRWRDVLAALISYSGVVVIATRGHLASLEFANPTGVALALLSTLIWAIYWLLGTRDKVDPVTGLFLNFTLATPVLLLYCGLSGELTTIELSGLPGAVYVGLFEMGLTFILWGLAMKNTDSTARTANLIFLSPPLSLVFIALVLQEPILTSTLAGLGLILAGLAFQRFRKTKNSFRRRGVQSA